MIQSRSIFSVISVLAGLFGCGRVHQREEVAQVLQQDLPSGSILPVFENAAVGVLVSANRALLPIRYSGQAIQSLVNREGEILAAIEPCLAHMESDSEVNLNQRTRTLERCVTERVPHGSNPGPLVDEIQGCVEGKSESTARPSGLSQLMAECVEDLKEPTRRVSIPDCVEQRGVVYEGYLPTVGAAIIRFDTDNVAALRQQLMLFESLECPGLVIGVDHAIPLIYLQQHRGNDNDELTFPNHLAYSMINASPAAEHIRTEMTPLGHSHVAIIDDYLDPSYGQQNELAGIDYYDMCLAAGQLGNPSEPSTYQGIDSHGTPLAGVIAGVDNGFGNNGVLRGVPPDRGKLSFFGTECSPDVPGLDIAMVLAAMEAIVKRRVEGIRVVCLGFGFQGLPDDYMREYKRVLKTYFTSVNGRRILWVASVGNDGSHIASNMVYPAGLSVELQNVISVAGVDPTTLDISQESNYGSWVDISAPSIAYTATAPGEYGLAHGTSIATAIVTGSMGLALVGDPGLSPAELRQLVGDLSLRRPIPTANVPSMIDVEKVVKELVPFRTVARSGRSSGVETRSSGLLQAGLGGFHFNFVGDGDEKIKRVGFLFSQGSGNLQVEYRDDDKSDYWWAVDGTTLPYGTTFGSVTQRFFENDDGELVQPVSEEISNATLDDNVIGLTGCQCRFTDNSEHNIEEFGAQVVPIGSKWHIRAVFGDDSHNAWECTVTYAVVGRHRVWEAQTYSGRGEGAVSRVDIPVNYFPHLIGSFSMRFTNGDHQLDHLSIFSEPGRVRMRFNDAGNDDPFDWDLTYYVLEGW